MKKGSASTASGESSGSAKTLRKIQRPTPRGTCESTLPNTKLFRLLLVRPPCGRSVAIRRSQFPVSTFRRFDVSTFSPLYGPMIVFNAAGSAAMIASIAIIIDSPAISPAAMGTLSFSPERFAKRHQLHAITAPIANDSEF